MAATGKTVNFELPLYNAGDAVSDLASFNSAMNQIDSQMEKNAVAAAGANTAVTALQTQVTKVQGDITALQTSVEQANGNAVGALNQIQELVNPVQVNVPPIISGINLCTVTMNDMFVYINFIQKNTPEPLTTTVEIGGTTYYATHKVDNSNLFRLKPNQAMVINGILYLNNSTLTQDFAGSSGVLLYYDGINSYLLIGINLSYDTSTHTGITFIPTMPAIFNRQPKVN